MGVPPVRVDLLQSVAGVDFASAYQNRIETEWEEVPISVIGLRDLIASKKAAGRPQDLGDAAQLEKLL